MPLLLWCNKYKNLIGIYRGEYNNFSAGIEYFPGVVVLTAGNLEELREIFRGRIFSTEDISMLGVTRINKEERTRINKERKEKSRSKKVREKGRRGYWYHYSFICKDYQFWYVISFCNLFCDKWRGVHFI